MSHFNPLPLEKIPSVSYNPVIADQNLYNPYSNQFAFKKNLSILEKISNTEQDYIDLFSYKRKGHMAKYVHMYRPYVYDQAIKQDSYYPFKMECELLTQKAEEIVRKIQDVTEAIEIGPGSWIPVMAKTVPLLRALEQYASFSSYKAIDSNLEYAKQACQIIKEQFKTIKTQAIETDFLSKNRFKNISDISETSGKKILFGFGQLIFGNNNDEDICRFLNNISALLICGDYLLFGVDMNKDESMIEAAYNNKIVHDLLLNTMHYLKCTLNLESFNPEDFESIYKWNRKSCSIEHYLKSKNKQILKIKGQKYIINKNDELNILNSRKIDLKKIENFLNKEKLEIKEIVVLNNNQQNKFSIVIAQKMPTIFNLQNLL